MNKNFLTKKRKMEQDTDEDEDNVSTEEIYLYNINNHIYFSQRLHLLHHLIYVKKYVH